MCFTNGIPMHFSFYFESLDRSKEISPLNLPSITEIELNAEGGDNDN